VDNEFFIAVASALFMCQDWDMLKPLKMGSEEMEARKADCVKWPNVSMKRGKAGKLASHPHIIYMSCYATCPVAEFCSH